MSYLNFIVDTTLKAIIRSIIDKGREAILRAEQQFGSNVIDPFTLIL
jgi:hypothetical protein